MESHRMTAAERADARELLRAFLRDDAFYLDSSGAYGDRGEAALDRALDLFVGRPELGFVWLTYDAGRAVAVCVVCFAISTSMGAVVAKLDDMFVRDGLQGRGLGSGHLERLKDELRAAGVTRIDTSVHVQNQGAEGFYARHGFRPLGEQRLACVL